MIKAYSRIKKYFSSFSFKPRREFKTISDKAHHDWHIILITFIFFFLCAVSFGLYVFVKASKGEIFTVEGKKEDAKNVISEKNLTAVIEFFESRRKQVTQLRAAPQTAQDPSI